MYFKQLIFGSEFLDCKYPLKNTASSFQEEEEIRNIKFNKIQSAEIQIVENVGQRSSTGKSR